MIYKRTDLVTIRTMERDDCRRICDSFREQGWQKSPEQLMLYYNQQESGERMVFVADYLREVAGYITMLEKIETGPFVGTDYPELCDFNVFMKFQGRDVGRMLIDEAEKEAAKISDTVTLCVGMHPGYGKAQRMYGRRGYIPDGSGLWYTGTICPQDAMCRNDDNLVMYLSKKLW